MVSRDSSAGPLDDAPQKERIISLELASLGIEIAMVKGAIE